MRDPLALFRVARDHEPMWLGESLETPKAARRAFDDFAIEAAIMIAERGDSIIGRAPHVATEARQRGLGLGRWPTLWPLWKALVAGDVAEWTDAAPWLWGPSRRSGGKLFEAVSVLARGRIVRTLGDAGWTEEHLVRLIGEWLDAGKVHRASRDRAVLVFRNPRAPVVRGRSEVSPATLPMRALAIKLANDDPALSDDFARGLAWIAARAGGSTRVSVPSAAFTQGKKRHPDAPGISARRGRKIWPILRDTVLRKTRGHSAGRFAAEFEILPEYRPILIP